MSYALCGCWRGPWHSISPPPVCDMHSTANRLRPSRDPSLFSETVITTVLPEKPKTLTVEQHLSQSIIDMAALAEAATQAGEVAQCDLWHLAIEAVRHAQAAVKKARKP